ncbi:hypothetical protein lacNasYZ03_11760 [Lactobacillus nasalidis]|uniref:Prophage protein n=1 Tax=Lactobacillus nasalidis TaxID=2797258 RepID=A0ABQ3W6X6_9LACO|nr:DUF6711 family protein [Lactobacillus nasalidis]GHV97900.1 hypothetical protein lacNasYZ01_10820 [Lactobacillus nasalidis]GHW00130.1 hypothetical protein lacNasYZ02_15590 [Lactobacillus nasalidis]GHW01489.1 hypothetical protein lacNasYZ03_11760 [Lactobacillus nasalidis]
MATYSLIISGTAVKTPSSFQVTIQDIDAKATRDAKGKLHRDRVATKRKISAQWPPLTLKECSTLLNAVKDEFFTVKYLDPVDGAMATRTFYVGDRTTPALTFIDNLGGYFWKDVSFDLVEQ